jgi:hypothetical protein
MAVAGIKTPQQALDDVQQSFELALKQNFYIPFSGDSFDDTLDGTKKLIKELSP